MKESNFLGTLLPSHPDFLPIEKAIREKYSLPELSPDDDPIAEVFLGDEIVPLEEFRKDIEKHIRENIAFIPPDLLKLYLLAKAFSETQYETLRQPELDSLPDDLKKEFEAILKFTKTIMGFVVQMLDPMINAIVDFLYYHLLTGETQEVPNDWISKVATVTSMGEPMVMAMAGPLANLDVITQQFRAEYKKTFSGFAQELQRQL